MKRFIAYFIIPMAIVSVLTGMIYGSVQQSYRTGANDPQIQLCEDISTKLAKGIPAEKIVPADTIDIGNSLSSFVTIFNENGVPIHSTGYLDGNMIQLPKGVFDYLSSHSLDEVSWQPRKGVRMAMVIMKTASPSVGFVAAGRSLKQVELREFSLRIMILTGWGICFILLTIRGFILINKRS